MASKSVKSHLGDLTAQLLGAGDTAALVPPRTRGSGSVSAPVQLAQFSADFQDLEKRNAALVAAAGQPVMVPLDVIKSSPYQIGGPGTLERERVESLVANLRVNKLASPVILRRLADGSLEVIAGHHRIAAYQELGRTEIESSVTELTDAQAMALVFFDNLFAPNLTAFQRFQGFVMLKQGQEVTHDQLAKLSGVSKAQVTRLMAFEQLPPAALDAIQQKPHAVGGHLAQKLAPLSRDHADLVSQAVEMVVAGELEQDAAAAWVLSRAAGAESKQAPQRALPKEVAHNGAPFAAVALSGKKKLMVTLVDAADMAAVEKAVMKALHDRAAAKKR